MTKAFDFANNPQLVAVGGTGLQTGVSGGILGFTAAGVLASSTALAIGAILVGGGPGATPYTPATTPPVISSTGVVSIPNATASTSTSTGALVISGGVGVGGTMNVAGALNSAGLMSSIFSGPGTLVGDFRNTNSASSDYGLRVGVGTRSAGTLMIFYDGGLSGIAGSITKNGLDTIAYNTSSDERGKPNRERLSLTYARSIVDALEIYDFDKEGNAIRGIGVLAQQAFSVHKSLATPGMTPDAWWQAEKAGPVPFLVANVQQNNSRIDTLEAELTDLKSRLAA